MSFWNGQRWVAEARPHPESSSVATWLATALLILGLAAILAPTALVGAARPTSAGCTVSTSSAPVGAPYVVSAWGLPTNSAVNIWVTEGGVTTGRPLGGTADGTFNLNQASSQVGVTTYAFSGPTKPKMKVYASCSVNAY